MQKAGRAGRMGQHPCHAYRVKTFPFSTWVYRQRNAVERLFNKLKHFSAVATRYDKRDDNFLASIQLASIHIWLRTYESVT
jgi:transposase